MIWAPPGWIERHYPVPDSVLERRATWFRFVEWLTWSTDPEGLYEHDDDAIGYVYGVDRDAGTIHVGNQAPLDADDPSGPVLLYRLAVMIGAQSSVAECWPKSILRTSHTES